MSMFSKYLGDIPNCQNLEQSLSNFFKLSKEIRCDLGKNSYFLDEYLDIIFKISEQVDLLDAKNIADSVYENIHNDVLIIIDHDNNKKKSKFFNIVEDYINKNLVNYVRPTLIQYYIVNIIMTNIETIFYKLIFDIQKSISADLDFVMGKEMHDNIVRIVGNKKIEKLNNSLFNSFFICPIFNAIVVQIFSSCSSMLLYRDKKSSKRIFRLMTE